MDAFLKFFTINGAQVTLLLTVLLLTLVLLLPVVRYLSLGWSLKRSDIMDGLNANARLKYFQMFCRTGVWSDPQVAFVQMETMYTKSYGRKLFVWPCLLLFLVVWFALFVSIGSAFLQQKLVGIEFVYFQMDLTGIASIAGAYMWVTNDFIWRSRKLDFSPADIHWGVLRLAIAVPMGYAFAAIASASAGPFVAFAIGAFPLAVLNKILQRTALNKLGYNDAPAAVDDDVVKLQGVNNDIAERLANEDITTITQVAYCDPVRLTMRSNLTFNVVTDLMNQALAWEYLDDRMNVIRPFGLRGAVEIRVLMDQLDPPIPTLPLDAAGNPFPPGDPLLLAYQQKCQPLLAAQASAQAALTVIVAALPGQSQDTLLNAFSQIAGDPFTDYLCSIWE